MDMGQAQSGQGGFPGQGQSGDKKDQVAELCSAAYPSFDGG